MVIENINLCEGSCITRALSSDPIDTDTFTLRDPGHEDDFPIGRRDWREHDP